MSIDEMTRKEDFPMLARSCAAILAAVVFASCGGPRGPESAARPFGTKWYCADANFTACGRTREDCEVENQRIGSAVVQPGPLPEGKECKAQDTAVCYSFFSPVLRKKTGDCFATRRDCEIMLKEARRAEAEHQDLSDCGTWD